MSADPSISLADSALTIPSDSENYSSGNNDHDHESSTAPDDASSSPMILYTPPSIWGLLRGAAINLVLPFVNGLMLGFGELFAHEAAFRLGWSGTKIFPTHRSRSIGPGVSIKEDPFERKRRAGVSLEDTASLE